MPFHSSHTSNLRFKEYNPYGHLQSKPICPEEWNRHEARIRALHAAKYKRADVLEQLRADCGCALKCGFSPSPSQYYAQLKAWGLRTYKPKGTMPTNSECTETNPSTLAPQVYSEANHRSKAGPYLHDPNFLRYEILENYGVINDQQQVAIELPQPDSPLVNESSLIIREAGNDVHSGRSSPPSSGAKSPRSAEKVDPYLTSSEIVRDAVTRVVQGLSDSELEDFFGNLTDTQPEELLTNDVKVKEACSDAILKRTGKFGGVSEGFEARLVRLVEIRDTLERRVTRLYCCTAQAASGDGDPSAKAPTNPISETSPAAQNGASHSQRNPMTYDWGGLIAQITDLYTGRNLTLDEVAGAINTKNGLDIRNRTFREVLKEWGMRKVDHQGRRKSRCSISDSTESVAAVQICDEDTEMKQDLESLEGTTNVDDSKNLEKMSEDEGISCSARVTASRFDYEVSVYASELWSKVNAQQSRLDALRQLGVLAGCFFAARSYADAFDLYFIIWTESSSLPIHRLAAAIDCARTSATLPQDLYVERILRHHLQTSLGGGLSFSSPPTNWVRETMLHSFLGDLYENLQDKKNAEAHDGRAMLHLDLHKVHINESQFPTHRQIIAALESQIAKRERNVSQAIGYNASTVSIDDTSKRFANEIQNNALLENLLAWCAVAINENSRGLDSFRSVLSKQPLEQRRSIHRALLCYLIEKWLKDRHWSNQLKDKITIEVLAGFRRVVSPPEALSAIAMLIVLGCPDQNKTIPLSQRQPSLGTVSSALLQNIKELMKSKSNCRSFSEVYLPLLAPSREVRRQSFDNKSSTMLRQFMMGVASTREADRHFRRIGLHSSIVPKLDVFQEFVIRPASLSRRLNSPHSSFSSGLNSMRATATRAMTDSVLSFAKRRSVASADDMLIGSCCSGCSFGAITGMPCAPPGPPDWEKMDHETGTIQEEPQDEEMVDV